MERKGAQSGANEKAYSVAGQREGGMPHHADSTTLKTAKQMWRAMIFHQFTDQLLCYGLLLRHIITPETEIIFFYH